MLETLREQRRNNFMVAMMGLIIVVFVVFFGKQSSGYQRTSSSWAATAAGKEITTGQIQSAMELWQRNRRGRLSDEDFAAAKKAYADDFALVHLLAARAAQVGIHVSENEVRCYIVDWHDGYKVDGEFICKQFPSEYRERFRNVEYDLYADPEDHSFSPNYRSIIPGSIGLSAEDYEAYKADELAARHYIEWLGQSLSVPAKVVLDTYKRRNDKIELEFVSLDPSQFSSTDPTDAEVATWAAANAARVRDAYDNGGTKYDSSDSYKLRRIYIRKPDASDTAAVATAKKKYEDILKRVTEGKEDFATVATAETELPAEKEAGGDMGDRSADSLAEDLFKAIQGKNTGEIVGAEQTFAWNIVKIESHTPPGKKPFESVQNDIAKELIKAERTSKASGDLGARGARVLALAATTASLEEAAAREAEEYAAAHPAEGSGAAEPTPLKSGTTGLFAREGEGQSFGSFKLPAPPADAVPQIGPSRDLVKLAFALTTDKPLVDHPVDVNGVKYIIRLKQRVDAPNPPKAETLSAIDASLRSDMLTALIGSPESVLQMQAHDRNGRVPYTGLFRQILDDAAASGDYTVREEYFKFEPRVAPAGSGG